jgi:7,8-dihydropterin-6-yl-methyl-4-(beta-D-ribofuranosyl)aminobenzene 5'-phosphate synthase
VDFGAVEAVVLSHGHWDHVGGRAKAFDLIRAGDGDRSVRCYLHPGMFGERGAMSADGVVNAMVAVPTAAELAARSAETLIGVEATTILDGMMWISGEVPRVTPYERGFPGHVRRAAAQGAWEPDPWIMDERFMGVNIRGRGVLIFSACSHAGIINVLSHAQQQFPTARIYGVIAGLHLVGVNEAIIPHTVRGLSRFNLALIAPGHCTGWRAVNALETAHSENVVVP